MQFDIQVSESTYVRADVGDLMELLGNLLDNACKYGAGKVRLSVESITADRLRISVEDNGQGFPEGAEEKLLQRGVRADF